MRALRRVLYSANTELGGLLEERLESCWDGAECVVFVLEAAVAIACVLLYSLLINFYGFTLYFYTKPEAQYCMKMYL